MFIPIGDQPNPRGIPYINYLLIGVNVAVFLFISLPLMMRQPSVDDPLIQALLREVMQQQPYLDPQAVLYQTLGNLSAYDIFLMHWGYRPADPSIITLFTSMFLHGGWLHIIGNMLFLWIYGDNVEHRIGRLGYLLGYLVTGLLAALSYGAIIPSASGNVPMVGASGAISGILGFYFLWFPRNKVRLLIFLFPFFFVWHVGARWVLGFYLIAENLLPFLLSSQRSGGGVAYGAHIGGFLAGLMGAYSINLWQSFRCKRKVMGCREEKPPLEEGQEEELSLGSGSVVESYQLGNYTAAIRAFLSLDNRSRREVPLDVVGDLADWLSSNQAPEAALGLYKQAMTDHPRGPGLDRIFLGIGLVLLHDLNRPTAAYQYLMDALDAAPSPLVAEKARQAIMYIERLQKLQIRNQRPWN